MGRRILLPLLCLDLALWFGASVYFSLFAALELSSHLPVDDFGRVIGILFPPYFTLVAVVAVIGWVLLWLDLRTRGVSGRSAAFALIPAAVGAVAALVDRLYFLPAVQRIEIAMGPISKASPQMLHRFGMTHGISLLVDFVMILAVLVTWIALALSLCGGGRSSAR